MEKNEKCRKQARSYKKHFSSINQNTNRECQSIKKKMNINDRFLLKSIIALSSSYKCYKGIDLTLRKYVTIYIKPASKDRTFSKNIKEELRQKITPPIKWMGIEKIYKNLFDIQVHARYGPSLYDIMNSFRRKFSQKTFYLLAYYLLKLIDRIDNAGYVHRSINMKNVIFNQSYLKNQLYFLNSFDLQRKNQQTYSSYDVKYCSVGTHLKLKACSKDTLESMCYMLMDFYLKGNLFSDNCKQQKDFLQAKTVMKPQGIPLPFLQFFEYIKNLGIGEQIKFTEWKIKLKKLVSQQDWAKPYQWIQQKKSQISSLNKQQPNIFMSLFQSNPIKFESQLDNQQDQTIELQTDLVEIDEGQKSYSQIIQQRILQVREKNIHI